MEGRIVDYAVLMAVGIQASGKRRVLGCEIARSEAEINWRRFLESLLARGLKEAKLMISVDQPDLRLPGGRFCPRCPGSTASSTCNRMPVSSLPGRKRERRLLPRCEPS
jgi:hypothetical protein